MLQENETIESEEAEVEQIEDVQDELDGTPVSTDYLGTITTIEGIMDAIGSVLNYVEVIGRELNKSEIQAFRWIEKAYCMPLYEQQAERLQGRQAQKFLDAAAEFEALLYPSQAENPQRIVSMRQRKAEEKIAKEEAKLKCMKDRTSIAKAERKAEEWVKKKAMEQPKPQPERIADPELDDVTVPPAKVKQDVFFSACMN